MKKLLYKGLKNPQKIPPFLIRKSLNYYVRNEYSNLVHDSAELRSIANNYWELPDNTDGLNASLAERIAPGGDSVRIKKTPNFMFTNPFVCEVNDVILSGPYAAGKTRQGKYIEDMIGRPIFHGNLYSQVSSTITPEWNLYKKTIQPQSVTQLATAAVIHRASGSQNFYHWMIDHILKLRGIEFYEKKTGNDVELIVSEHIPGFAREAIDLLGFGNHSIIKWKENKIRVDKLIVPSWPDPTPGNLHWIESSIRCGTNEFGDKEWVYISRQNASRGRKVANFDELAPILNDFGVEVIYCEEYSLEEQIELFRSVNGVISPHGAGLTGMIWTDSLSIIELFNGIVKMPFYVLADILEHEYAYLIGEAVTDQNHRGVRDRDLVVDPDDFENLLEKQL